MSTRARPLAAPRADACWCTSAAKEYGSSPDEHPALLVARAAETPLAENLLRQHAERSVVGAVDHHAGCRTAARFWRTIALSGSSSSARSQQRIAASRSLRRRWMLPVRR